MATVTLSEQALRDLMREVVEATVAHTLGNGELIKGAVAEALEDIALAEAIRQGRASDLVGRDEVLVALDGEV